MLGATARVDAAAFDDGRGFAGIDPVWDKFAKENPDIEPFVVKTNRQNYGDARLDRMFLQGLDVLFGSSVGANGKSRQLRAGDELKLTLEEAGFLQRPKAVEHACKVVSVTPDQVVVRMTWKLNGFAPQIENGKLAMMVGGDIQGTRTITFIPRGGLVTRLEETIERTVQSAPGFQPGVAQWTREATDRKVFSLVLE
jgi:hypothetical protein